MLVVTFERLRQLASDFDAISQLLAEMAAVGIKLTGFHEVKQTVEELYLKLSHGQVM